MKRCNILRDLVLAASATIVACGFTAACNANGHPDDKQAVYNALTSHELPSVVVDQDRGKGIIKLTGVVGSPDSKTRAEQLAQQAAPGYTIQNQLTVNNTGIMSMANPNAKAPEVQEMAHPPVQDDSSAKPHPRRPK